ncbi:MAG: Zn-dependent oligopeptidase, partial [Candidatus Pacebacteria bacterium]|nr:Zn-dependent oligopeptidase [Candidatus Paceibacterota bacterium]
DIKEDSKLNKLAIAFCISGNILDKDIFEALKDCKKNDKKLNGVEKKLLEDYLKTYKRMGFSLSDKKQKEVRSIIKKILKFSLEFQKNINDYHDFILLNKEDTVGLKESFLKTLKKDKKNNYIVSLDYPEYGPFVLESENIKKRKELIQKNSQKGGKKNLDILKQILMLKDEKAKLLGYKNHAEYVLENRMAKKPETVLQFHNDLEKKVKKIVKKDLKELLNFKKKSGLDEPLKFYDVAFFSNKLKKEKFNVDPEEVRKYFVLENVKKEMFNLFGSLFGVKFKKKKQKLWHEDVELFAVEDKGAEIAYITFDFFPREGKYGHACVQDFRSGYEDEKGNYILPITSLVTNFRKPNGKIPSMLSLGEIETLFHEFGHAIHNSLTKVKHPSFSGFNVVWHFVELPSQLLENWVFNEKVLKKMSSHYQTGKKIPKEFVGSILKSRRFMDSIFHLRTIVLGKLDYDLHTKKIVDFSSYFKKLSYNSTGIKSYEKSLFPASFGHIVGGYDSGYYSYLWALVFADDVFSEFEKCGVFSKKIGKRYKKEILEVGGSRDERVSLEKFLKRKSDHKAFLKNINN